LPGKVQDKSKKFFEIDEVKFLNFSERDSPLILKKDKGANLFDYIF
jgi:hypothetical protein